MPQRRNRRAGVEDLRHKRDGTPSKLHRGACVPRGRCQGYGQGYGQRWRARYVSTAGQERTQSFSTKAAAQQYLDSVTTSLETGAYVDPIRAKTTVETVAATWADTPS